MTHTKLVFLRHGRTEWNELGKLQGQADVELDEVGEKQAEEAARFFADWDFEACYTSDLKRALRTAHMVAEPHGLDVVPDARLREIAERHEGQQVLIVTHGLLLSKVVSAFMGIGDVLSIPGNITYSLVIGGENPRLATYNTPARQLP